MIFATGNSCLLFVQWPLNHYRRREAWNSSNFWKSRVGFSHRFASFRQTIGFKNGTEGASWSRIVVCILRAWSGLPLRSIWVTEPTSLWPNFESFSKAKHFINTITKLVSDAAKRNVKLHIDYSTILTDNSEERARILRPIEENWSDYPDFRQTALQKSCLQNYYLLLTNLSYSYWGKRERPDRMTLRYYFSIIQVFERRKLNAEYSKI